jgi:hypothetical protein
LAVASGRLVGALALAVVMGCRDGGTAPAEAGFPAEASSPPPPTSSTPPTTTTAGHPTTSATRTDGGPLALCRVMSSEGGPSPSADATSWLDVPAKANFTVRTLETGRELRFEGPGRVRPCGSDVALVAEGSAVGLPGSGEAPGAEQWVATACGVARWASGVHRFSGSRDACRMQTSLGSANLWLADDITADDVPLDAGAPDAATDAPSTPSVDAGASRGPWRRIDGRRALRLKAPRALVAPAAVLGSLVACEGAAERVQTLAARMNGGDAGADAGATVGELAAESVVARGVARAACAVAAVRMALAGPKPAEESRLEKANSRWLAPRSP